MVAVARKSRAVGILVCICLILLFRSIMNEKVFQMVRAAVHSNSIVERPNTKRDTMQSQLSTKPPTVLEEAQDIDGFIRADQPIPSASTAVLPKSGNDTTPLKGCLEEVVWETAQT